MNLTVSHNLPELGVKLAKSADVLSAPRRQAIFSRAAYSVANLVRRHILRIALAHHLWAAKLGAQPTEFFGKAARRTTSRATSNHGLVTVASPGFSRAFHDVEIRPTGGRRFLTIPKNRASYGHTVKEMRSHYGWKIFRPGTKKILIGYRDGERVPLFALAEMVRQRKDRSLLPSDGAIDNAATAGAMGEIAKKLEAVR